MTNANGIAIPDGDNIGALFKAGMRRLASGVSLVATCDAEGPKGFVATSVSSVAAEPAPSLLVCVNRAASSHDALVRIGMFSVNILAEDDADVARRFGSADARHQRFEAGLWVEAAPGVPVYRRALASFGCEVEASLSVGTHTVLIGRVVAVAGTEEAAAPLVYYAGAFASVR